MTYDGRLLEVEVLGRGTSATTDVAVGAVEVPVEDLTEFSDEGGRCEIDGVAYDYSGIIEADDGTEGGTLVLADPLAVAVAEADPVLVVVGDQAATDAWAVIDLGSPRQDVADDGAYGVEPDPDTIDGPDVGDVVRVPLSFSQRLAYREGVYEPPLPVQVAADLSSVIDVPGVVPVIDGGMIDPDTLPTPPSGPTEPPGPTPGLTVTAGVDLFILRVANSDPEWSGVQIEYHATQAAEGVTFTPTPGDPATLIGTTNGVLVARTLAVGTPFAIGTDYAFAAIARVGANVADPSAPQVARLDPSAVEELIVANIVAGFVLAGRVQFGTGYLDADEGIVLPQPDGSTTRFPIDGITPSTISGFLIANGLTVKGDATFNGLTTLNGSLQVNAGVPDPTAAPDMAKSYVSVPTIPLSTASAGTKGSDGYTCYGLLAGDGFLTLGDGDAGIVSIAAEFVVTTDPDGTVHSDWVPGFHPIPNTMGLRPYGGLTKLGSFYYILTYRASDGGSWQIWKVDAPTMLGQASNAPTLHATLANERFANKPILGNDGTDLVLAWVGTDQTLRWQHVHTDGTVAPYQVGASVGGSFDLAGIYVDSTRLVAYPCLGATVFVIDQPAGARVPAEEFRRVGIGTTSGAMIYDNDPTAYGFLHTLQSSDSHMYAQWVPNAQTIDATYAWISPDSGNGILTTAPAPIDTLTSKRGESMTVSCAPPPMSGSAADKASLVRVYVKQSDQADWGSVDLPAGVTDTDIINVPAGSVVTNNVALPTVSTFLGAGGGVIESEAADAKGPRISLKGDGSWRLGDLSGDATGKVAFPDTGWITLASTVSGTGVQYRVLSGVFYVWLSGSGTITNQAVVANGGVPAAYRPSSQISGGGLVSNTPGALSVTPAGAVWATTTDHSEKTGVHGAMLSYPVGS